MPVTPRPAPRHRFDSPPLIRTLAAVPGIESAPSSRSSAEHLGQWLAWTDAIALSEALSRKAPAANAGARPPAGSAAVIEEARQTRLALAGAIAADTVFAETPTDGDRCRVSYRAHQHDLAARVASMRSKVRAVVAAASPAGAQLAALDAVLDRALATHERRLLATVPTLLHRHASAVLPEATNEAADGNTWQRALLAELEARWQPVQGLIESLGPQPASSS